MKQKIKIMKHKPELSDEEIRGYMDFDALIASRKLVTGSPKSYTLLKWALPIVVVTGIAAWFFFPALADKAQSVTTREEQKKEDQSFQPIEAQIPSSTAPTPTLEKEANQKTTHPIKTPVQEETKQQESVPLKNGTAEDVYIQAEPLDGYAALYSYFNTQLVYPKESLKDSIHGVQTISFIINPEGRSEKIQVKQSLGVSFEKEATRLIENMPLWKPASLNGKPVPSQISLPLTFQIEKVKTKEQP